MSQVCAFCTIMLGITGAVLALPPANLTPILNALGVSALHQTLIAVHIPK